MTRGKTAREVDDIDGYLPGLAIDTVIFGFHQRMLKILILKYRNTNLFALPGGFIKHAEDLDDAARRILTDRTGLANIYLEQFYAFGDHGRFDPSSMKVILGHNDIRVEPGHWLLQRFVSIGYYALVDLNKAVPSPDPLSERCDWYELDNIPPLMQDHNKIVQKALETLRLNLDRQLTGSSLLPRTFTMGDLQSLYETILGENINRSSFQRKMLGLDILERVDKKWTGGAHKAPYLYRFR
jgi:ADP-ribose pyrophosphatase YjhB (NUDIX family)